ncbi:MAG: hypothetical protein ACM3MF_04310, partial [Anaerolineae bacterium]
LARVLILAMVEVLGESGARAVARAAEQEARLPVAGEAEGLPPLDVLEISAIPVNRLMDGLERVYGAPAGRGLARRVGRACVAYALRSYGESVGLTGNSFRLLPMPLKIRRFGEGLAKLFNRPGDERLQVEEQEGRLLVRMERCPLCRERHEDDCVCQLAVGAAEESLYWLSGGKIFHVEESACAARGDPACTLQIDLTPMS